MVVSSPTRGIVAGGYGDHTLKNKTIEYVTISTLGNATDFGDLTMQGHYNGGNCSNAIRGLIAGGGTFHPCNTY